MEAYLKNSFSYVKKNYTVDANRNCKIALCIGNETSENIVGIEVQKLPKLVSKVAEQQKLHGKISDYLVKFDNNNLIVAIVGESKDFENKASIDQLVERIQQQPVEISLMKIA